MKINNSDSSAFRFSHDAMTTFNQIEIHHPEKNYAYSASQEAFRELDRLEMLMSRFNEGSDIWRINHTPHNHEIPISIETYECLQLSKQLNELTSGAFDITLGQLVELWDTSPNQQEIEVALKNSGLHHLQISDSDYSVTKLHDISVDLGAIGKGYIIDKISEIFTEWDIECVLINSGGSSFLALDPPPGKDGWNIACGKKTFSLSQGAISASGMDVKGNHIINPRTGHPTQKKTTQWSMAPTAAIADAVSTAAMIMTPSEKQSFINRCPEIRLFTEECTFTDIS